MVLIDHGWGFRWKFCVLVIYVICIIMINMKNILHYLYFASFKLFNRIISMYMLRANIHNKKTYVCGSIDADGHMYVQLSTYRSFFGGVSMCSHFDVFYFYFLYICSLFWVFSTHLQFSPTLQIQFLF